MSPTPFHLLRTHAYPLHALHFSPSAPLLYSGDEEGNIAITDLRLRRVVAQWKAHEGGVLTVGEWDGGLVRHPVHFTYIIHPFHHSLHSGLASHGRDNFIHFYYPFPLLNGPSRGAGLSTLQDSPKIIQSMTVNALNFCKFSLVEVPNRAGRSQTGLSQDHTGKAKEKGKGKETIEGFLAVPNLLDTETVDIYSLPSLQRVHAAVLPTSSSILSGKSTDAPRSGLVMSLNLHFLPTTAEEVVGQEGARDNPKLRMVVAMEDGRVECWSTSNWKERSDRRLKLGMDIWKREWSLKGHNEAIMAMTVSPTHNYAFSISADHLLCRYDLGSMTRKTPATSERLTIHATKQIGNSSVAVLGDGKVVAVGGWDGSIRLFSTKSFKLLGTLVYHRHACHVIAFPQVAPRMLDDASKVAGEESDEEEYEALSQEEMSRWMASGGKDKRIALWKLMDFRKR